MLHFTALYNHKPNLFQIKSYKTADPIKWSRLLSSRRQACRLQKLICCVGFRAGRCRPGSFYRPCFWILTSIKQNRGPSLPQRHCSEGIDHSEAVWLGQALTHALPLRKQFSFRSSANDPCCPWFFSALHLVLSKAHPLSFQNALHRFVPLLWPKVAGRLLTSRPPWQLFPPAAHRHVTLHLCKPNCTSLWYPWIPRNLYNKSLIC